MEEASAIERARIVGRQVGGCGDSSRPTAAGRDRQQPARSGHLFRLIHWVSILTSLTNEILTDTSCAALVLTKY